MITNEEILKKSQELNNLILDKWLNQELFSSQWFIMATVVLISYGIFFYFADKKRITELLLFGSLVAVAFVVYNTVGLFFGYWTNYITITPVYPDFFGSNLTIIPLYAMLIYQYTSSWKSYISTYILYSIVILVGYYYFVLQELEIFKYLKPYAILVDFPLFLTVGIIARGLMIYLFKWEKRKGNIDSQKSVDRLK